MGLLENFKKIVFSENQVEKERRKKLDKKKADDNDKEEKIHKAVEILAPIAKEGVANWCELSFEKRTEIWKNFKNKIESKNQEFLESLASKRDFKGHTLEDDDFIKACKRMIIEEGKLSVSKMYENLKNEIHEKKTETHFFGEKHAEDLHDKSAAGNEIMRELEEIWEMTFGVKKHSKE